MKSLVLLLLSTPIFAAEASPASALSGLPFLIIMFALMYFLLIRPQQKRAKAHKAMLVELKKGDEVVTNGGILGIIKKVEDSFVIVQIAENMVVKVQKQAINQKMPKGSAKID